MRSTPRRLVLTLALAALVPLLGPAPSMQPAAPKRPIQLEDTINWKSIGATVVSNDGQWFAYRIAPSEGDAQIVVRRTRAGEKEMTFDIGEPGGGAAGAGGGRAAIRLAGIRSARFLRGLQIRGVHDLSDASRRAGLRRQRRPVQSGVTIVNLATGEKREYAHSPIRLLGRRLDVDCFAAAARSDARRRRPRPQRDEAERRAALHQAERLEQALRIARAAPT
jgi:hypothetical protein